MRRIVTLVGPELPARPAEKLSSSGYLHLEHHIIEDRFQVFHYLRLTVGACVLQRLNQPRQISSAIVRASSQLQSSPLP
jgi:hypothetical protein